MVSSPASPNSLSLAVALSGDVANARMWISSAATFPQNGVIAAIAEHDIAGWVVPCDEVVAGSGHYNVPANHAADPVGLIALATPSLAAQSPSLEKMCRALVGKEEPEATDRRSHVGQLNVQRFNDCIIGAPR
jgi:hypothetical protein